MENSSRPNWFKITDNFRDYVGKAGLGRATGPAHAHRARPKPTVTLHRQQNHSSSTKPFHLSKIVRTHARPICGSSRTIRVSTMRRLS
ncbi:MAG: hypothetical protein Q4A71_07805 [Actinomycetaceae bacterium]|nr:hypothetical protein [Actinomycetaceae bacterium]